MDQNKISLSQFEINQIIIEETKLVLSEDRWERFRTGAVDLGTKVGSYITGAASAIPNRVKRSLSDILEGVGLLSLRDLLFGPDVAKAFAKAGKQQEYFINLNIEEYIRDITELARQGFLDPRIAKKITEAYDLIFKEHADLFQQKGLGHLLELEQDFSLLYRVAEKAKIYDIGEYGTRLFVTAVENLVANLQKLVPLVEAKSVNSLSDLDSIGQAIRAKAKLPKDMMLEMTRMFNEIDRADWAALSHKTRLEMLKKLRVKVDVVPFRAQKRSVFKAAAMLIGVVGIEEWQLGFITSGGKLILGLFPASTPTAPTPTSGSVPAPAKL